MGTIKPKTKQRKKHFSDMAEAQSAQADWELERTLAAASVRSKPTPLTQTELAQAEAAIELLRDTGTSLLDGVRHFLRSPPTKRVEISFAEGYKQFLRDKEGHVSERQLDNHKSALSRFSKFLGPVSVAAIMAENVTTWLKSLDCGKKSWNLYRSSVGAFFNWAAHEPRLWVEKGPMAGVVSYRRSETLSDELPERLTVEKSEQLMRYLEAEMPHWVAFFATALFCGIRPEGETAKLADAIERDGVERYLRDGCLHLTAKLTKDRRARPIPLPKNLLTWLDRYPLTPKSLRPGSRDEYASIRSRFGLPHDGLRHTSISAWVALHGVSEAAYHHGTSERVIRAHYLSLMKRDEAEAFYAIFPLAHQPSKDA